MAKIIDEFKVCTDCLFFIAYGDLPTDKEDADRITDAASRFDGYLTPASDEDEEFSYHPCGCCRSARGGSRHRAVLLR